MHMAGNAMFRIALSVFLVLAASFPVIAQTLGNGNVLSIVTTSTQGTIAAKGTNPITITATPKNGFKFSSWSVNGNEISANFVPVVPPPTDSLTANPTSIAPGGSSTLTWASTNATSCTGNGFTASGTSGSASVSPSVTTTYGIACTGAGGSATAHASVSVTTPPAPTVTISANPASIVAGGSSTLAWSSTNAISCSASGAWSGSEATSGMQPVSPSATSTYGLTCSGAGGSASASASVTVNPVVTGGNCGLQLGGTVIFCEPFDVVNSGIPSRTGALDPNVWGVSRTWGYVNFSQQQYNTWGPTALIGCGGTTTTVTDPNDVQICNGQLREASNDNLTGDVGEGSVTALTMYPKQPFDFAGRTGAVSFDLSNDSAGFHAAWPEFWMSDLPVPAPFEFEGGWVALPQNGFGLRFSAVASAGDGGLCPNSNNLNVARWTVNSVVVSRNYVFEDEGYNSLDAGTASNPPLTLNILDCVISPDQGSGAMNHVEILVNQGEIDVYATDAGVAASPTTLRKIASVTNANLTLTRGLVWLEDVHYNAGKDNAMPNQTQHTFVWDNLAFDGPFPGRDFTYDALDVLTPFPGGYFIAGSVNLGQYSDANQTASWNVPGVPANPQAAAVRVLFNFTNETNPNPTTLTVIVNGNVHTVSWPYPDTVTYTWRTFAVTIPITDLVAGTNVVQLGSNQPMVSSNVNILLAGVPGAVPVLPGNSRSYP